jgi:1,4-dihydroxy-2-naphthoyl-CoA synthase
MTDVSDLFDDGDGRAYFAREVGPRFAGEATRFVDHTNDAVEGRDSSLGRREPDRAPHSWQF